MRALDGKIAIITGAGSGIGRASALRFAAEGAKLVIGDKTAAVHDTAQLVKDAGGEPLVCAAKAIGIPSEIFQQILLFLDPAIGTSVTEVYRLSRLYDALSERSARIMLAAWRGATMTEARAKYRSTLYDDGRNRTRTAPAHGRHGAVQPGTAPAARGTGRNPIKG